MSANVLILGSSGQLGHMLEKYLKLHGHHVLGLERVNMQVCPSMDLEERFMFFAADRYDYIINCIGATKPHFEQKWQLANNIFTNAVFPHMVADWGRANNVKVIHITTDCFIPNTKVYTPNGFKNIQDIIIGQEVVTHTGNIQRVYDIKSKFVNEKLVKIKVLGGREFTCTKSHPIYSIIRDSKQKLDTSSIKWNFAGQLKKHNLIAVPKINNINNNKDINIELLDYSIKERESFSIYNNAISMYRNGNTVSSISKKIGSYHDKIRGYVKLNRKPKNYIKETLFKVTEELAWLFGLFTAEGSLCNRDGDNSITFCIGEEPILEEKITDIINKYFGFHIYKRNFGAQKGKHISVVNKLLASFFKNEFYTDGIYDCYHKKIPDFILTASSNIQAAYINGLSDGDAHYRNNNIRRVYSIRMSSEKVIGGVAEILYKNGIYAYLNKPSIASDSFIGDRVVKSGIGYTVRITGSELDKLSMFLNRSIDYTGVSYSRVFEDDNYYYVPIVNIEEVDYVGLVFNLEVENDNSYLIDGFLSAHNCVFTGNDGEYTETDVHDATDDYGRSKSLGEPSNCMVLRTSIIGTEKNNSQRFLLSKVINSKGTMNGFEHHWWSGVTTLELSRIIKQIMDEGLYSDGTSHIYSGDISKRRLLELIVETWNVPLEIVPMFSESGRCDRTLRTIKSLNNIVAPKLHNQMLKELKDFSNV